MNILTEGQHDRAGQNDISTRSEQKEIWMAILLNLSTEILFYDIVIGVVTAGL